MRYYLSFILAFLISISNGQDIIYPPVQSEAQHISGFVPAGWYILDSAFGDLNKDGLEDAAIILQTTDSVLLINGPEDTAFAQPRILLVLFRESGDDMFLMAEESDSFILMHDNSNMDDPYQDITIDKGVLKIYFQLFYNMGSWYTTNSTYKFRYDENRFVLIGADVSTIHRATLDYKNYSYNFLTKNRICTKGNEQKNIKETTKKSFALPSLKTFETFKKPYSWEIETDVYL